MRRCCFPSCLLGSLFRSRVMTDPVRAGLLDRPRLRRASGDRSATRPRQIAKMEVTVFDPAKKSHMSRVCDDRGVGERKQFIFLCTVIAPGWRTVRAIGPEHRALLAF